MAADLKKAEEKVQQGKEGSGDPREASRILLELKVRGEEGE